jgi:hypothetical protein
MLRKLANTTSPVVEITREGDEFTFKTQTVVKNSVSKFKLGEEFEEERLDGKKVKVNKEKSFEFYKNSLIRNFSQIVYSYR